MNRIIMFGSPGAGKGTLSAFLSQKYGHKHISTGDVIREIVANGSPFGEQLNNIISKGELIPDELIWKLIRQKITENCILDGYPRTVEQAANLIKEVPFDCVIYLHVDHAVVMSRLAGRGRADDSEDIIRHRIHVYQSQTEPVISYLQQHGIRVYNIDSNGLKDEVSNSVESLFANCNV